MTVSDAFADAELLAKLDHVDLRSRRAFARVSLDLQRRGVPPDVRLHYLASLMDLGHIAHDSLSERVARAEPADRPREADFRAQPSYVD